MAYINRLMSARPLAKQALHGLSISTRRNYWPSRYDRYEEIQRNVDRVFREFDRATNFRFFFRPILGRAIPIETNNNGQRLFKLEIDLPDFKPDDIQVTVKKGEVIIKAKSENSHNSIKQNREFSYRYSLPEDADLDKIKSSLKADGCLVIEAPLPKIDAKSDHEIPIKKE